jgi:hypothetical protein
MSLRTLAWGQVVKEKSFHSHSPFTYGLVGVHFCFSWVPKKQTEIKFKTIYLGGKLRKYLGVEKWEGQGMKPW